MREITYSEAINEAVREEMRRDSSIVLLGQDIGEYGGTFGVYKGIFEEFGEDRVRDGPLSEAATVGVGIGLAINGMRAVVDIEFIDFSTLILDAVVNQAAKLRYFYGGKLKVPIVIRLPSATKLGLGAQHSQSLEAWFMHAPGLLIAMPSTPYDAKGLLKTALRQDNPVVFIEHVRLYRTKGDVPSEDYTVPFGRARIVKEGSDITLVALAAMVSEATKVAEELEQEGISVEVIDPRTLAPLDRDTLIASVRKTGRAIITHEAYKTAGAGAEIGQTIMEGAFDHLLAPIQRVAGKDIPIPAGVLENRAFPSREELKDTARLLMGGS
jgi:acetoin:2,6-dichlorophenolindophenol oxidoreductase subunit beta